METLCVEMLSGLKRFQDNLHQQNEIKAKVRQRMYFGLKESLKYVTCSKIRMVIIARDLQQGPGTAGLDQLVDELLEKTRASRTPVVCALTRKKLQKLSHKPCKVSGLINNILYASVSSLRTLLINCILPYSPQVACVAVVDPSGREEQFERLKQLAHTKEAFDLTSGPQQEEALDETKRDEVLRTWTSTTRRGKFEFAVDKLF